MALASGIHMLPTPAADGIPLTSSGLVHQLGLLCIGALLGSLYDYA